MVNTKYGKYFIDFDPKQWPASLTEVDGKDTHPTIAQVDNHIAEGAFFYRVHWMLPGGEHKGLGHPPHVHKESELLFHIGTNPDDPMDLGAVMEMHMGEEMERHIITKSTVIWIPGGLVHSPWKALKIFRPFIVIQVLQSISKTEKFRLDILPKELLSEVDMSMVKDVGF
jgi:hypothetical protein